jgi:hypothetical protein
MKFPIVIFAAALTFCWADARAQGRGGDGSQGQQSEQPTSGGRQGQDGGGRQGGAPAQGPARPTTLEPAPAPALTPLNVPSLSAPTSLPPAGAIGSAAGAGSATPAATAGSTSEPLYTPGQVFQSPSSTIAPGPNPLGIGGGASGAIPGSVLDRQQPAFGGPAAVGPAGTQSCVPSRASGSTTAPPAGAGVPSSQGSGVPASQFKPAGVPAERFERPGVSAAQLNTMLPGARTPTCDPPRDFPSAAPAGGAPASRPEPASDGGFPGGDL